MARIIEFDLLGPVEVREALSHNSLWKLFVGAAVLEEDGAWRGMTHEQGGLFPRELAEIVFNRWAASSFLPLSGESAMPDHRRSRFPLRAISQFWALLASVGGHVERVPELIAAERAPRLATLLGAQLD